MRIEIKLNHITNWPPNNLNVSMNVCAFKQPIWLHSFDIQPNWAWYSSNESLCCRCFCCCCCCFVCLCEAASFGFNLLTYMHPRGLFIMDFFFDDSVHCTTSFSHSLWSPWFLIKRRVFFNRHVHLWSFEITAPLFLFALKWMEGFSFNRNWKKMTFMRVMHLGAVRLQFCQHKEWEATIAAHFRLKGCHEYIDRRSRHYDWCGKSALNILTEDWTDDIFLDPQYLFQRKRSSLL